MEDAEEINGTIIHQSGRYGEHLGILDIEIDNGAVKKVNARNLSTTDIPVDSEMAEVIGKQKALTIEVLIQPLYEVERDIWHDVVEENPITNLLADGLREVVPCDMSIINSGIISGGIKKGAVSDKKLLEISPSPLNPTYMEIMGKDIKEALALSLKAEVCLQEGRGAGFRGRYLGRLHVSGAKIEHDGKNILSIKLENEELKDDKIYRVATSDYLQRGAGYESLGRGKNEKYNREFTRDTLREYLNKKAFVENSFQERWIKL